MPINRNLTDIQEIFYWCEHNEDKVQEIIKNANQFAEDFLAPLGIREYTTEALNKYSALVGGEFYRIQKSKDLLDYTIAEGHHPYRRADPLGVAAFAMMNIPQVDKIYFYLHTFLDWIFFDFSTSLY